LESNSIAIGRLFSSFQPRLSMSCLRAGAYRIEITPYETAFLAGFSRDRRSTGVHDDLYARCLVLESKGIKLGFVALDLIGLFNGDVFEMRRLCGMEEMIVACTHTHSGPDTIGLWGPSPESSGVDERYVNFLKAKVSECIRRAISSMADAKLSLSARDASGISKNVRKSSNLDNELLVAKLERPNGGTIATLINFASHPEVLGDHNTLISADFPGYTCNSIEHEIGGCAIYLNGAIGGMVTPDASQEDFESTEVIGHKVAKKTIEAFDGAELQEEPRISLRRSRIRIPLVNDNFSELLSRGVLRRERFDGHLWTEVTVARVAGAQFATIPGEAFPDLGLEIKKMMRAKYKFVLGIAEDELGYIMQESDFKLKLYNYEQSMSVGPKSWPILKEAVSLLLQSSV